MLTVSAGSDWSLNRSMQKKLEVWGNMRRRHSMTSQVCSVHTDGALQVALPACCRLLIRAMEQCQQTAVTPLKLHCLPSIMTACPAALSRSAPSTQTLASTLLWLLEASSP